MNIECEEWEMICDKCEGRGSISNIDSNTIASRCSKCQGAGKVDWIENIVGKAPTKYYGTSSSSSISSGHGASSTSIHHDLKYGGWSDSISSQQISQQPSKITEKVINLTEYSNNKIKVVVDILKKWGGLFFDNRIVS